MPAALARYWANKRGGGGRKRSGGSRRSSGRTTIVLAGSGVGKKRRGGRKRGGGSRGFALVPSMGTLKTLAISGAMGAAGFIGVEKLTLKLLDDHQAKNPAAELPFYLKPGYGRAAVKAVVGGVVATAGTRFLGRDKAWGLAAGVLLSAALDAWDAYNEVDTPARVSGSCNQVGAGYTPLQLPESAGVENFDARRMSMTA